MASAAAASSAPGAGAGGATEGGAAPAAVRGAGKRKAENGSPRNELSAAFAKYAEALDAQNEKRERLVKASRDVTIHSKKVIFATHRATSAAQLGEAESALRVVREVHLGRVALDLGGTDHHHFARAFSPGVQEYTEAATFLHFCQAGKLLTLGQLNASEPPLCDAHGHPFTVSTSDYLLGVADLTGEVMRMTVSGSYPTPHVSPHSCRDFVQALYAAFTALPRSSEINRELGKKLEVMLQSLHKIEQVVYALHVRGSEYPADFLLDTLDRAPDLREPGDS